MNASNLASQRFTSKGVRRSSTATKINATLRGLGIQTLLQVVCAHLRRSVHARLDRVYKLGTHFDHVADQYRPVETDAPDVNRDAVLPAPPDRAGISGLV